MASNTQCVYTPEEIKILRYHMVSEQVVKRHVTNFRVVRAMKVVPRHLFVPEVPISQAYADRAQPIGEGQTISQPYMVAKIAELLDLNGSECVLEVGACSGYQAAILGQLARRVVAVEFHQVLAKRAQRLMGELKYDRVSVVHGDGKQGFKAEAPYEAVVVSCAVAARCSAWEAQLKPGGVLVYPWDDGGEFQILKRLTKGERGWDKQEDIFNVRYVPLL